MNCRLNIKKVGKTNQVKVSGCVNCPFVSSEFDDYALNYDSTDICTLSKNLGNNEYIIWLGNRNDEESYATPEWCPLRNEKFLLSLD